MGETAHTSYCKVLVIIV